MFIKEKTRVFIDDINCLTFSKNDLLEIIEKIPDNKENIKIIPFAFWFWDDTVYRICFEYIIEREETITEKTLREAREAREKKVQEAIKKALNGEYKNNGLILQAMMHRMEKLNIIF